MDESLTGGKEFLGEPIPAGSEDPAKEIIPALSQDKSLQETETENMEVHKHPHHITHKKKWTEYLLEFFMIFLAVFLGFFAETEREHIAEKKREVQFISSLARDLELDTTELSKGHIFRNVKIRALDSAISILAGQNNSNVSPALYRLSIQFFGNRNFFQNSGTMDQLKNSGGLRLISNRKIVDSIEAYDQQIKRMAKRDDFEVEAFLYNRRIVNKLFDYKSVVKAFGPSDIPLVLRDSTASIKLNPVYLDEHINDLRNYEYLIKNNDAVFEFDRQKAISLLEFLKGEYHLE